ncbi:hypothetical protein PIB30_009970 [Stylosanthes scabra]|uniref:Uncharacterized protein n=1 Tax=Stylosanthes scabra TaxID=79078 RepID=A0ABU6T5A5_9FABA|nr:hypothetical protein [Stylosanthes scabra]
MAALCCKKQFHGYSKMEKEDPEEMIHRRAQFLIYKVLQQADSCSSSSSSSRRIRICKLKVKIGNRLRRLRKRIISGFHGIKAWKRFFAIKGTTQTLMRPLPPLIK